MAKLKAPLLSLGASGAIAKTIVFFPWKGINAARQYVVPANPRTSAQNTQRGHVIAAVAGVHAAMADAAFPLSDDDRSAYSLLGSLERTPRTWFNTCVKVIVDQLVAGKKWALFTGVTVTPGAEKLTILMNKIGGTEDGLTEGLLYYGTSKSAMLGSVACTTAALATGKDILDLTPGIKYYCQFRATTPATFEGLRSGIVYGVPEVAPP